MLSLANITRRRPLVLTPLVALVAVSLLAVGCGTGSSSRGATTTAGGGALAVARCMRSHGLSNWPAPTTSGHFDKATLVHLGYSDTRVRAVGSTCGHLLPAGPGPQETAQQTRTRVAYALSFARCMRARGFPSFPDPTAQGQLTPEMVTGAGIDLHQQALLQAGLACVPLTHGLLSRAAIERAVHGG